VAVGVGVGSGVKMEVAVGVRVGSVVGTNVTTAVGVGVSTALPAWHAVNIITSPISAALQPSFRN
jgi:hypothetical protein